MSKIELRFEYGVPPERVYRWWTDLSGAGYVGKKLRSIKVVGREGEKTLVETKWKMMGMTKTMIERFTVRSPTHWVWEPRLFGIAIVDDFELSESPGGKTALRITSKAESEGPMGKMVQMVIGGYLDRIMVEEWESADQAMRKELRL